MFVLLLPLSLAYAEKTTNPADYTINVHVQSSRLAECGKDNFFSCGYLDVVSDGKKFELKQFKSTQELLRVGDYKAKIDREDTKKSFVDSRSYDLLLPDGSALRFDVVGESE
jgi:hypothetical protein